MIEVNDHDKKNNEINDGDTASISKCQCQHTQILDNEGDPDVACRSPKQIA